MSLTAAICLVCSLQLWDVWNPYSALLTQFQLTQCTLKSGRTRLPVTRLDSGTRLQRLLLLCLLSLVRTKLLPRSLRVPPATGAFVVEKERHNTHVEKILRQTARKSFRKPSEKFQSAEPASLPRTDPTGLESACLGLQETGCGERKKASYSTRSSQARNGSRAGTATHVLGSKDDKPRDNGCASHKVSFLRIRENQSNPTISRVRWFMAFASSSRKNVITFERKPSSLAFRTRLRRRQWHLFLAGFLLVLMVLLISVDPATAEIPGRVTRGNANQRGTERSPPPPHRNLLVHKLAMQGPTLCSEALLPCICRALGVASDPEGRSTQQRGHFFTLALFQP